MEGKKAFTDSEIIAGIRKGGSSKQRFSYFVYQQYAGFVYKGMKQYRLSKEAAIDAYGDAIIGLCRRIEQGAFEIKGNLGGYLYRSFCNRCVDRIRKDSSFSVEVVDILPNMPTSAKNILKQLLLKEKIDRIRNLMRALGEKCKQLLLEAEYWGYSPDELVDRLGYKDTNTLSSQKYRCMTKLRKLLQKEKIGPEE